MEQAIKIINEMIEEQKREWRRCKDGRTTRMKNTDSKNWGMVDATNKIEHYREVKRKLTKFSK